MWAAELLRCWVAEVLRYERRRLCARLSLGEGRVCGGQVACMCD